MNHISYSLLTVLITAHLGCASIQDVKYKSAHALKAHAVSAFAPRCPHFNDDYKCGFSQGYYDYSLNRTCKPPTIPPKEYWKAKYENPRGQQQIEAWYRGYEMGMLAAEQDCGNCWHRLHPRGLLACEPPLSYPTNMSPEHDKQLDMPHSPDSQRRTNTESIPAPAPIPQRDDIGLFGAPEVEIQPTAYEEPSGLVKEPSNSEEPARLNKAVTKSRTSPLFAAPPVPH